MPLPYSLDLARLSAAYASRELTPGAVVRAILDEIEASREANPAWICVRTRDTLLERAAALEGRKAQGEALPLYGVPFAIKDNIDLAGEPTTAACPAFSHVAAQSAHAVDRLERAGALCIGKTNMDQFATGLVGTRSPYGACRNPFDARYISGGSSSGSAVAVALGHVSFALGTDTAGSGRVPAGFCNIVGLKPTRGLISTTGILPACRSLDCVSVFALTAPDAWAVAQVLDADDPRDPYSRVERTRRPRDSALPLRCGVPRSHDLRFFGDAAAKRAFERALKTVEALGCDIVEFDYTPFAEAAQLLYNGPWVAERLAAIKPFFSAFADEIDPVVRRIIAGAAGFSAVDAFEGHYRLEALKRLCMPSWDHMDMLMVPTSGTVYRIDEIAADPVQLNSNLGYYTNFVNLLDLAALAVPAAFREDGLPSGVTFIAPALEDAGLVEFGARFHRAVATRLGATPFALPEGSAAAHTRADDGITLAVVGAHLTGMPLNHQLASRGARHIETCSTAPQYRLYALPGTTPPKPGLARVPEGPGAGIEVELWSVPAARFGSFVAEVPPPLAIGTLTLLDGREVKGFVCEPYALAGARDITSFGGWRNFMKDTA